MSSVAKLRDEMQNVPKTFKDIFKNSQKNWHQKNIFVNIFGFGRPKTSK